MTVPFASLLFEEIANNLKKQFLRRLTFHSGLFFFTSHRSHSFKEKGPLFNNKERQNTMRLKNHMTASYFPGKRHTTNNTVPLQGDAESK